MTHIFTRYDGKSMLVSEEDVMDYEAEGMDSEYTILRFKDGGSILLSENQDSVMRKLNRNME